MTKLLVIPLFLFYLLGTSGICVSTHYCCGRLASIRITGGEGVHPSPPDQNGNGCCHDLIHLFHIQSPSQISQTVLVPGGTAHPVAGGASLFFAAPVRGIPASPAVFHAPPIPSPSSLFIRYGVFRI